MKSIYTMVGMQHRHSEQEVANLKRGEVLMLRRDPHNAHDKNAVEVWHHNKHVAFIKATEAVELARVMDKGGMVSIIGRFVIGADRWPQVEVDV